MVCSLGRGGRPIYGFAANAEKHLHQIRHPGPATRTIALPARAPGMSDEIHIGARYYWQRTLSDEELLGPLPEPPEFSEDIAIVRERIRQTIGKVTVGRAMTIQHPVISRLVAEDEARREKHQPQHLAQRLSCSLVCARTFGEATPQATGKPVLLSMKLKKDARAMLAYLPGDAFWAIQSRLEAGTLTFVEANYEKPLRGSGHLTALHFFYLLQGCQTRGSRKCSSSIRPWMSGLLPKLLPN
jgi:hypothetical protein